MVTGLQSKQTYAPCKPSGQNDTYVVTGLHPKHTHTARPATDPSTEALQNNDPASRRDAQTVKACLPRALAARFGGERT